MHSYYDAFWNVRKDKLMAIQQNNYMEKCLTKWMNVDNTQVQFIPEEKSKAGSKADFTDNIALRHFRVLSARDSKLVKASCQVSYGIGYNIFFLFQHKVKVVCYVQFHFHQPGLDHIPFVRPSSCRSCPSASSNNFESKMLKNV